MSSPNGPNRLLPFIALVLGGLALYSISRGTCPFNPAAGPPPAAASQTPSDPNARLIQTDETTFDQLVLQSPEPVLVDFYADWCGPCRDLAPILDRVAAQLTSGRIVKVNVDENPRLASRYGINSLPTLLFFVNGQIDNRFVGVQTESELAGLF